MIAGPTPVNTAHGIERPPSIELVVELLVFELTADFGVQVGYAPVTLGIGFPD